MVNKDDGETEAMMSGEEVAGKGDEEEARVPQGKDEGARARKGEAGGRSDKASMRADNKDEEFRGFLDESPANNVGAEVATPATDYAKDIESLAEKPAEPQDWHLVAKGSGQCEYQGFDKWTPEEQDLWRKGKLRCKWGVGQVSIRLPIQDCQHLLALIYGFLPFIIPIWWALWVMMSYIDNGKPRFFPLYGLNVAVSFALINELVVKKACRRFLPSTVSSRPPEAVCKHPGMPSGHVMNAYTLMTWSFLEAFFDSTVYPEWLLVIVCVLGPVPWARVHNKDHTRGQVQVSAVVAILMGSLAFCVRKIHFPSHDAPWDWYVASAGLKNPYVLKWV